MYIDSSIRILTDKIGSHLTTLKNTWMLSRIITLKLNCYTNPLMYKWFGENTSTYEEFYTMEAGVLLFQRSLLTTLLMKAWLTCALDKSCIDPPGSKHSPCCGCHRYDQDALTVVSSFFYAYPKDLNLKSPAFAFTTPESRFFDIERYKEKSYFTLKTKKYY